MIDQTERRNRFNAAVDLLGGQRRVAQILDVTDRTVRNLASGRQDIRVGMMHDVSVALRDRAAACADLAKATDPLFNANRTAAEIAARPAPTEALLEGEPRRG